MAFLVDLGVGLIDMGAEQTEQRIPVMAAAVVAVVVSRLGEAVGLL